MDGPNPETPPTATRRVEAREFRNDMVGFLRAVQQGASFVITADGKAVAELRPPAAEVESIAATLEPASESPRRLVGSMRGKIWMADNWDTWPEGFIEEMTEGPIFPLETKGE